MTSTRRKRTRVEITQCAGSLSPTSTSAATSKPPQNTATNSSNRFPEPPSSSFTFATQLYRTPEEFEIPLARHKEHLRYRWRSSSETTGITTLRNDGELASLAILASGINPDADRLTLEAFQTHLLRELHGTEFEPAFGLREANDRPLVAVVAFAAPPDQVDQVLVALADRCFAAAYFRYLNLA